MQSSVREKSGHAVVLGASIGGLLAARVLSGSYGKVTVFDRDTLPSTAANRKGVPQDRHLHGLLARGRQVFEELFPGLVADLTARGAVSVDMQRDLVWYNNGNRLPRAGSGLDGLCVSRATLEACVRERVAALPAVTIHDRHEALGLLTTDDGVTVNGVRVIANGGPEQSVHADLVVDATGRGNRGPQWLAAIGYDRPAEEIVSTDTVYMSRDYRREPGDADFAGAFIGPRPDAPRGGFVIAADGERWMVVLLGVGPGQAPPSDPQGYLDFARALPGPELYNLLSRAEPLEEPRKLRLPPGVRRRYERMTRLPRGFIAFGDAICSLNPSYGQGMSVLAVEATVLREWLRAGPERLPRRFFTRVAKVIDVPWSMAVASDLRYPFVAGHRSVKTRILNAYVGRVGTAASRHPAVARQFLSVANLVAAPPSLFAPGVLARVLRYGGRAAAPQSRATVPAGPAPLDTRAGRDALAGSERAGSERAVEPASAYPLKLSVAELVRFTFMTDVARATETDLWQRAGIVPGARIADVGCGPGAMFHALAEAVGPHGRIEAVDADPGAVATARAQVQAQGLGNVTVSIARADETGLEPGAFDVVIMRHVLGHNVRQEEAIVRHLATLLRPGGCLYLVDSDVAGARVVPHHPDLVELDERYRALHRTLGNDGQSGLRLGQLIRRAGLELVDYHGRHMIGPVPAGVRPPAWAARDAMIEAGLAGADDVERWGRAFALLDASDERPTFFVPMFMATGRRTA